MNDLEICKKIAEIEGVYYIETKYHHNDNFLGLVDEPGGSGSPPELIGEYNPLTDDALCFQLMIKYKVAVQWLWDENDGTPHYMAYAVTSYECVEHSDSPNKAILLSIITAEEAK